MYNSSIADHITHIKVIRIKLFKNSVKIVGLHLKKVCYWIFCDMLKPLRVEIGSHSIGLVHWFMNVENQLKLTSNWNSLCCYYNYPTRQSICHFKRSLKLRDKHRCCFTSEDSLISGMRRQMSVGLITVQSTYTKIVSVVLMFVQLHKGRTSIKRTPGWRCLWDVCLVGRCRFQSAFQT